MKRCPECGRDYNDDSMSYCLDDGFELLFGPASMDEPATAILSEAGAVTTGSRPDDSGTKQRRIADDDTAILSTGAEPRESLGGLAEKQSFSSNSLAKPLIAVVVAAVVLIGSYFAYRYFTPSKQIESIAVMPFVNESGNADVEYLSDGMTETLIKSLSQVPNLAVKSRSTVFYYKGKETSPKKIGEELNVQAVLLGRVGGRGDDLKLSLELVHTQTEDVIWSEQYDRKQSDLVSIAKRDRQRCLKQGRNAEAIRHLESAAELANRDGSYLMELGYGYGATGKRAEATATVKDLEAKYARRESNAMYVAAVYSGLGERDKAFEWLEKAFETKEDLGLVRWRIHYESLRDDPRSRDLLKRMGLPE